MAIEKPSNYDVWNDYYLVIPSLILARTLQDEAFEDSQDTMITPDM